MFSALVVAAYISYESFTKLQRASNTISQPDYKIKQIDRILIAVSKTENTLQEYTVSKTEDKEDKLKEYYKQVANVKQIIESLESETQNEEYTLDSVLTLLKTKLVNFEDFVDIKQQRDKFDFYDQALKELEGEVLALASKKDTPHFLTDTARQNVIVREDKGKWLRKMAPLFFKDREKEENNELNEEGEENETITLAPDSVKHLLRQVRNNQARLQKVVDQRELTYLQNNAQVIGSIYDLVDQLKQREQARSQERVEEARTAMNDAIIRIAIILVVAFLSTIVIVYLILADITRSDFYRSKLVAAKSRAERLARVKEDFLANMSHEIRTPLTAILGFTEQLQFSKLDEQQKDHVKALDSSSKHLLALVNDILDFSKIEANKISFEQEPFDVVTIILEVKRDLQLLANQKQLNLRHEIQGEELRYIVGDAFRLKQVLYNLVSNALKFTHEGEVVIAAHLQPTLNQQTQLTLEVRDTGIGIPKEKQNSIFNAFHQSDVSTTRKYGGTGLGLAICKRLIKGQGGKIELDSQEGVGSIFRVMLTCAPASAPVEEPVIVQGVESQIMFTEGEALVIDDNPLNGTLLDLALKGRGITAVYCSSGREGLAAAEDQVFDIIFCDLHMPEMDGAQVVKELKNNPMVQAYETPIIAFTANVQSEDRKHFEEIGVHDFLLKPFNQAQLDELLRKHLPEAEFNVEELLADTSELIETPDSFSLERIKQFTGDDLDALIAYLETFITTAEQSAQRLEVALEEKSLEETSFHAHKLVSQVELLQEQQLASRLKYLEQAADSSSWNDEFAQQLKGAIVLIEQLIQNMQSTVQELKSATVD
uniref:histidine kinase n=1 Tax=Roseihalotalea indica TaxID=2867963 RepID=A0AA49JFK1_9BACT|nr:ATP-binding protein [Tunicatimonas sp. TK19036]